MNTKICCECHTEKPLSEFSLDKHRKDGYCGHCKKCGRKRYGKYRDAKPEVYREAWVKYNLSAKGRRKALWARAKQRGIPIEMSVVEFERWYDAQEKVCHYCSCELTNGSYPFGRTPEGWRGLSIDRKDTVASYSLGNIVLCCRRCNLAKGWWFTEQEMLEIAKKYFENAQY